MKLTADSVHILPSPELTPDQAVQEELEYPIEGDWDIPVPSGGTVPIQINQEQIQSRQPREGSSRQSGNLGVDPAGGLLDLVDPLPSVQQGIETIKRDFQPFFDQRKPPQSLYRLPNPNQQLPMTQDEVEIKLQS